MSQTPHDGSTEHRVTVLETQRQACLCRFVALETTVFGNGKPSIREEIGMLKSALIALETKRGQNIVVIVALVAAAANIISSVLANL